MEIIFITGQSKIMNPKSTLLNLIPLITFISVLLPTANIAKAASSPKIEAYPNQEIIKGDDHSHSEEHGASGHNESSRIGGGILSEKAKKIEFIVFLSLIVGAVFAPEIFYNKSQGDSKNQNSTASHKDTPQKQAKIIQPDTEFLKAISAAQTKKVDLFGENHQNSDQTILSHQDHKSA